MAHPPIPPSADRFDSSVRHALRLPARAPGFTLLAILTLGLDSVIIGAFSSSLRALFFDASLADSRALAAALLLGVAASAASLSPRAERHESILFEC